MHETVRQLDNDDFYVTAVIARWHAATATLTWVNCGHPPGYLVDIHGELTELTSYPYSPLGVGDGEPSFEPSEHMLEHGGAIDPRDRRNH
jgi:serine phosphatase RsbU (regulator of sigma subunit)